MKTYAIHWKSSVTGNVGTGTKLFERGDADRLVMELNEHYPDIDHEAIVPAPTLAELPNVKPAAS